MRKVKAWAPPQKFFGTFVAFPSRLPWSLETNCEGVAYSSRHSLIEMPHQAKRSQVTAFPISVNRFISDLAPGF